jgi:hypothetical protein
MRRLPKRLCLASFAIILMFSGLGCVGTPKNPTTVKQVEDKVRSGVAVGSSRSDVETWLDSEGIKWHGTGQPEPMWVRSDGSPVYGSVVEKSGIDPETIGGMVSGTILDTKRDFLVKWSIAIDFFFDKEDRLIKYQVRNEGTGL